MPGLFYTGIWCPASGICLFMCGGIEFTFSLIPEEELLTFLSREEVEHFKKTGNVQIFFWSERPVLPVEASGAAHLYDWGNREKTVDLPRTGWARIESLMAGTWNHLHPEEVLIPASRGYEKKIWFGITTGIQGVLVEKAGIQRVYMLTQPADARYQALTKHDRMPKFV